MCDHHLLILAIQGSRTRTSETKVVSETANDAAETVGDGMDETLLHLDHGRWLLVIVELSLGKAAVREAVVGM